MQDNELLSLIRIGEVVSIDAANATARVTFDDDGVTSYNLRVVQPNTLANKDYYMPDIGEAVTILGNSDGRGVVTEIRGHILGVGPQQIEVDAPFVAGNSGSPVLNRVGRVVGVASYLRNCRDNADWSKRNTRYNGVRRFALRLSGIRWQTR